MDKYRIDTIWATWWDYSNPKSYMVTICSKNRQPLFGKVLNAQMLLSWQGQIVQDQWQSIPKYYDGKVRVDEFIVMPDHFHGIITIKTRIKSSNGNPIELGQIVNQFKRGCTIEIKKRQLTFAWQSRYHDIIIPNSIALQNIRRYIKNNPKNYHNS